MAEQRSSAGSTEVKKKFPNKLVKKISLISWEPDFKDIVDGLTCAPLDTTVNKQHNNAGR